MRRCGSAVSTRRRKYAAWAARAAATPPAAASRSRPYSRIVSSIRKRAVVDHLQQRLVDERVEVGRRRPGDPGGAVGGDRRRGRPRAASASRRSSSVSRSQLQATTARSVRCRGSAVRLPPVSSRNRSSSRSATCAGESVRSRAAASSIASGSPSSRRQISTTRATFSSVTAKPGRTAAARSRSNCTDGYASGVRRGDVRRGQAQRRYGAQRLAEDAQRLAGRGEHPQPRAPARAGPRRAGRPRR